MLNDIINVFLMLICLVEHGMEVFRLDALYMLYLHKVIVNLI
jgi:hypothetical protein